MFKKNNKNYTISTDSTADLPDEYIKQHNLVIHTLFYNIDDVTYGRDHDLNPKEFYNIMREGKLPTTMASNPADIMEAFLKEIELGNDILHISFSSALSSSYSNAVLVAEELADQYPETKIVVLDSLCASMGQGLLVHKALLLKEAGHSMQEVSDWVEQNKLKVCHQFTVDDLFHLHRGGRVSKASAVLGTLINVKPILHVNNEGKLIPIQKIRGRKKALTALVDQMAERFFPDQNDIIFISDGDCKEDAEYVKNLITERFGITNFLMNYISPTIGTHSGPATVALFFMGKER